MNLNSFINSSFVKILIIILTFVGTVIAAYSLFFLPKVRLNIELLSNTNLYVYNTDVDKLKIFFDSTNLKESKESLRLLIIKFINTGDIDILKSNFDNSDSLGVSIKNAQIIEKPEIIKTSNDYIKNNLKVSSNGIDKITFGDIIIDKGDYFIIKILLKYKGSGNDFEIRPIGKISGQKTIVIDERLEKGKDLISIDNLFDSKNINILLFVIVLFVIIAFIIVIIVIKIRGIFILYKSAKIKSEIIRNYINSNNFENNVINDLIITTFIYEPVKYLYHYIELLKDVDLPNKCKTIIEGTYKRKLSLNDYLTKTLYIYNIIIKTDYMYKYTINNGYVYFEKFIKFLINEKHYEYVFYKPTNNRYTNLYDIFLRRLTDGKH